MLKDIWEESSLKDALADMAEERGMRKITASLLESRFGSLDDDLKNTIEKADESQLIELTHYLVSSTLEQIRVHLGLSPKSE